MNTTDNHLTQVLQTLQIPSLPKKVWNGEAEFNKGVCLVRRISGMENYAICRFNKELDEQPCVVKDFSQETFMEILTCYPIPDYAENDIENMQFDNEESKEAMQELLEEKEEEVMKGVNKAEEKLPEWIFPFIKSQAEAVAYLKSKKVRNAHSLKDAEAIKAKLYVIYMDEKQN